MERLWSIETVQKAWQFASKKHKGQLYGGKNEGRQVEYLSHIGSVVFELMNCFALERTSRQELSICCALLHDVIEDTEVCYADLSRLFGKDVADGVQALSKNDTIRCKDEKMMDSLKRIKAQPAEVWLVKLADRICNMQEPPKEWNLQKKLQYLKEAEMIYTELKDASNCLSVRLSDKIETYKKYL